MTFKRVALLVVALVAIVVAATVLVVRRSPTLHTEEAIRIAVDAYIYGYPLVTFDMARRQQTNVAAPDAEHAPVGQMIKMRSYPAVDNHCCAAPNADTLYTHRLARRRHRSPGSSASRHGRPLLHHADARRLLRGVPRGQPERDGRHGRRPMRSPARAGPARCPEGVTRVDSPTAMVWILGRIYCTGTPEDYTAVHALQDQFTVVPLSAYGKPYTPPAGAVDPEFDMKTGVRKQVNALGIYTLLRLPGEAAQDEPAEAAGRRDRRADGEDRHRPGAGLRRQQARRARPEGDRSACRSSRW